jgi:hypothetical protein
MCCNPTITYAVGGNVGAGRVLLCMGTSSARSPSARRNDGEWASDAGQSGVFWWFSDAPRRTRRAPFDTHWALPRCSRIDRTALVAQPVIPGAKRGRRRGNHVAVAPAQGSPSGFMPAVLFRQVAHPGMRMLLAEPSQDGPPDIVIQGSEDAWPLRHAGRSYPNHAPVDRVCRCHLWLRGQLYTRTYWEIPLSGKGVRPTCSPGFASRSSLKFSAPILSISACVASGSSSVTSPSYFA